MAKVDDTTKRFWNKAIVSFLKYYPVRIKNVGLEQEVARRIVWDFKDGKAYEEVAQMTAKHLKDMFGDRVKDIVFSCVPASTTEKNVKSAKRKNRFSKTKLKSQIGKSPKRKRPVSRHTHKNRTAFERLSNGIQTLFFYAKKDSKKHCQFSENSYLYIVLERVLPLQFFAIS